MKRILKISALLSISVVYCLVIGIYSGSKIARETPVPQNSESGFFTNDFSSGFYFRMSGLKAQ